MFKKLWYKVFGLPTVDGVLAEFHALTDKLHNVVSVHSAIASVQEEIIADAAVIRSTALREVDIAFRQIKKVEDWLA